MLNAEWLSAFVPIGALRGRSNWLPFGAGVLFNHGNGIWVVTAGHVLEQIGWESVAIMFSRSTGPGVVVMQLGDVHREAGLSWVRDAKQDLACALVPTSTDIRMKAVTDGLCIALNEVTPSQQCFTVGCPYGVRGFDPDTATPLVLSGVISGTSASEGLVYTSAPTFPGNSGGPLVVVRSPFDVSGRLVVGQSTVWLAGIVIQTTLVSSPNPEDRMPPLHLGIARSVDAVLSLLGSTAAKQQLAKVQGR
jgi:hypothetical protein